MSTEKPLFAHVLAIACSGVELDQKEVLITDKRHQRHCCLFSQGIGEVDIKSFVQVVLSLVN